MTTEHLLTGYFKRSSFGDIAKACLDVAQGVGARVVVAAVTKVVVACNQVNLSIQERYYLFDAPKVQRKVAEKVNLILCSHQVIPVSDQVPIHLFDGIIGAVAILDYVLVPEMGVGAKPDIAHGTTGTDLYQLYLIDLSMNALIRLGLVINRVPNSYPLSRLLEL